MTLRSTLGSRRPAGRAIRLWSLLWRIAAISLLGAWVVGRALTDRFGWSQYLWWIPTPAILTLLAMLSLLALRSGSRWARLGWPLGLGVATLFFAFIEHRVARSAAVVDPGGALRILHWNMGPSTWRDIDPSIESLLRMHADLSFITDAGGTLSDERIARLTADGHARSVGRFGIITRLPLLTLRPLVGAGSKWVVLAQFDTTHLIGHPLTVYLVDLPSSLRQSRIDLGREIRRMLNEQGSLPAADLVIGDFNITRGSSSIATMFPGMPHAFDLAGHGYGASFHRLLPLYHIDHMLVGDSIDVLRYDLIDPGIGRHMAQQAWIRRTDDGVRIDTRGGQSQPMSTPHTSAPSTQPSPPGG